jgi:ribonuclease T1
VRKGVVRLALTGVMLLLGFANTTVHAREWNATEVKASVAVNELPPQGQDIYQRIRQGGPFASERDGAVFGNRERLLPTNKRGYYREYTVKTPGTRNRGTRRIVCGGPATVPDDCYYTADHYASFRKIVP